MRTRDIIAFAILSTFFVVLSGCNNQPEQQSRLPDEDVGEQKMEPTITDRDAFVVMGTSTRISASEESGEVYEKIWADFEQYNDLLKTLSTNQKYCGVSFNTDQKNIMEYLTAMAVPEGTEPAHEKLIVRKIPAARYAVFESPVENIGRTGKIVFKDDEVADSSVRTQQNTVEELIDSKAAASFRADDTGPAIKGKRIDIYLGEGRAVLDQWLKSGGNRYVDIYLTR